MFRRLRLSRAARGPAEVLPQPERGVEFVDSDDYAIPINRSALIVRVKQPFIEWANSIDDGPKAELNTYDPTLLLVDELAMSAEWHELEKDVWGRVFSYQLAGWHRNPKDWPQNRTLAMFREWFDVELHLGVCDASEDPLLES